MQKRQCKILARKLRGALEWNENQIPFEVRNPNAILAVIRELEAA